MASSVAFFDRNEGFWYLLDRAFYYGNPGDLPLLCDWNGDGSDTVGLYRSSTGFLHLRNTNSQGFAEVAIFYGTPEDLPLCGDWDGDGVDTVGVYRPSQGRVYLRNRNTQGFADRVFDFGWGGIPFSGDFDGDGRDEVGLHDPWQAMVWISRANTSQVAISGHVGLPGDRLLVEDFDGDGRDWLAAYRAATGEIHLLRAGRLGPVDAVAGVGRPSGVPVAGHLTEASVQEPIVPAPPPPLPPPTPRPEPPPPSSPEPAATVVPLYDTAWEMAIHATAAEADAYFAHLAAAGFAGAWVSYFQHTLSDGTSARNVNGHPAASGGWSEPITLDPNYRDHVRALLDAAARHGQEVGLFAMWAVTYVNNGQLTAANAYGLGHQLGEAFGRHPAVSMWLMGGDNFRSFEDVNIWRNLVAGLRDAGAAQPVGYHPPAWPGESGHLRFVYEDWVDFIAPQTGHCQDEHATRQQLAAAVAASPKPVYAGELRYEALSPTWCHAPGGEPVPGWAAAADVVAARDAGVAGILYGHNERRLWGRASVDGGSGRGGAGVLESLGSEGERMALEALRP